MINIVICDDDEVYAKAVYTHLSQLLNDKKCKFHCDLYTDSFQFYQEKISSNQFYDIAFLDIEMTPYSGLEFAKTLKEINPFLIVFMITSYAKYLDDALDLNIFRYLTKPLDLTRFSSGIDKALLLIDKNTISFFLKKDNEEIKIPINDIVYFETVRHATKVVTNSSVFLSKNNIDYWEQKLIASFFYRIHKSFIINMKYITNYRRDTLTLLDQYDVPISYRNQAEFKTFFFRFFGGH